MGAGLIMCSGSSHVKLKLLCCMYGRLQPVAGYTPGQATHV